MIQLSEFALDKMLRSILSDGVLRLVMPFGEKHRGGNQGGHPAKVRLHNASTSEMAFREAYLNGSLTIVSDDSRAARPIVTANSHDKPHKEQGNDRQNPSGR